MKLMNLILDYNDGGLRDAEDQSEVGRGDT